MGPPLAAWVWSSLVALLRNCLNARSWKLEEAEDEVTLPTHIPRLPSRAAWVVDKGCGLRSLMTGISTATVQPIPCLILAML